MTSPGEPIARATGSQRRGSVGGAGVSAITTAVGRLLIDYAVQLREDLQSAGVPGDVSFKGCWSAEGGRLAKIEDECSDSATDNAVSTCQKGTGLRCAVGAVDEAAPLTEADVAECRQRLQRLQRVTGLLTQLARRSQRCRGNAEDARRPSLVPRSVAASNNEEESAYCVSCEAVRQNPVLMLALRRFDRMAKCFQGAATAAEVRQAQVVGVRGAGATASVLETNRAMGIQPLLNLVPLAEGVLSAFSRNVDIVFRRRRAAVGTRATGKRPRGEADDSAASSSASRAVAPYLSNYWELLAAQQRRRRFALYTTRSALLPRVNAVCAPLYVSPAVRELAQLNLEAERLMLQRAWCVHTKAHLLREVPWVARDVASRRAALREELQGFTESQQDAFLIDVLYADFLCAEGGIVRVCVQHALFVDLTYDVRRRNWVLIALHWNLFTTSAGASLVASQTALAAPYVETPSVPPGTTATAALPPLAAHGTSDSPSPSSDVLDMTSLVRVLPHDREALHSFLQLAFAQEGLSGGLHAANRLVCAVVMDTLATQLQSLQKCFFTGSGLGGLVEVEVRAGTLISFHLSLPQLFVPSAPVVHGKITVVGGTVMLECVRGTDLSTRRVTLPLGTSSLVASAAASASAAARKSAVVVVDMEALLWQCARA
ncbi:hypothetical protein LSCM1_01903 [Leishmania martiniquensis]|uniref:Uncharacterized protein n=1 Tax=Leishmania martiniquensis TaxID=1580590 RepID=A0A836GMW5_9TRYP|nr:hypothetical protein LSCM1_01903 [Leishmania martiniquensis]